MKKSVRIIISLLVMAVSVIAISVHAQNVSSSAGSAAGTIGAQNDQQLRQALGMLGTTLNQLDARLQGGNQITNSADVNASLSSIHGSLLQISGTVAALSNRSTGVAQSNTPKLPNTGGGGAAALR